MWVALGCSITPIKNDTLKRDMNEPEITIDADAAFMNKLGDVLSKAFPDADVRWHGPLREAEIPPEAVQWVFAGTQALFTITGGADPAIDYVRAAVNYLRSGYRSASSKGKTLRPTVLKYSDKEIVLDDEGVKFRETKLELPWDEPKIAERIMKDVLGREK